VKTSASVSIEDHVKLAVWAADCAEHVLTFFESEFPDDDRPRQAVAACRAWAETRQFRMSDVRSSSLAAHAAARAAKPGSAAQYAARAAGQAAATPHVPTHALGPAWYGAKVADVEGLDAERDWQYRRLPGHLRAYVLAVAREKSGLAGLLRYPGMA
jgi:Imm-5 like putative immunity protein